MKLQIVLVTLVLNLPIVTFGAPDIGLAAKADGAIITILADKKSVVEVLPRGLILVPIEGLPSNLHPVVLYIGKHIGLSAVLPNKSEITVIKGAYNEATYGIPSVRAKGMKKTYTHVTTLLLDSVRAIVGGYYYGFPKLPAKFELDGNSLQVHRPISGEELITAKFDKVSDYDRAAFQKNFDIMRASLTPLIVKRLGRFECIRFDWKFDSALVSPVDVSLAVQPEMAHTVQGKFISQGLDKSPLGAFHIQTNWKMSSPYRCQ